MADLDPTSVPPEYTKEGADWLAVFNPHVPRVMDVKLEAKFTHDRCVCEVGSGFLVEKDVPLMGWLFGRLNEG